ncbi:hypothetical protein A2757_00565 [Candidatus Giovannonibacteria bacterium RIFCSPHIGHO2_01_FULL_48_47]|nr:MAG: hypothetical protein A2757_00565 [Candidatus Giovannonibacteria bacterium RIFCSPHIGHO2_01_FULL_48_47]OGF68357.1 MAG: hypothetical protein A3D61_00545 [Candidatus Giovannonibacteria bacterium RIFCSPHIGHO2_02_FULL_48_15]OGF89979.1 MAG: hypothetical protein A3B26_01075 [Candidatus Giovannonibacteria bacterium RIFCSPLOWO2_01_FULL_48_47]OGF95532.1 MAG: hypothetical protein A2433_02265 [Candidatus Giovannonibacteria bacterium RIFOXYC1_FULL_48_8]OGF96188.1 MAG: hypothetical protein A2613_01305
MKTILANVSTSFFVRNFLRTDVLQILNEKGSIRLVLLAPWEKLAYYRREFPQNFLVFEPLPEVRLRKVERFFKFLETSSIHARTTFISSRTALYRVGSKVRLVQRYLIFVFQRIFWHLGRFRWWRNLLRKIYFVLPNSAFDGILEKYRPDLIFCSTMVYMEDYVLAKAAKKRGIKVLGMTLSWDNFYGKTFLLVKPDWLFLHTDFIKEQAEKFGDFSRERTTVVGIPQYDRYFRKTGLKTREEFFKEIGADPSRKLILYGFSGKAGLDIEFDIVDILAEAVKKKELSEEVNVLIRPYPRYDFPQEKISAMKTRYGFLATPAVFHVGSGKGDWEFDEKSINFLLNSLAHADLVISMYSTFFIEAAIFDKPLVAVAFDGYQKRNYWNSARRFFDWEYLSDIKPLDGVWLVRDKEEFIRALNKYLSEPGYLLEGRRKIVEKECQFQDGFSGERLGKALLDFI